MPAALAIGLLLAGCERGKPDAADGVGGAGAGAALEQAAIDAGIVTDPAKLNPVGAYASETDRVCIVPQEGGYRVGASVDYGDRQSCVARGTASGRTKLRFEFGDECTFEADFDGGRVSFPATLPSACDTRCTGRATLTALSASRLSDAEAEARAMRGPDKQPLCG
ncbi:hypothetical protein LQ954_08050 [Sphingomonas sp. IC-11]|nr:hypothetical protein [Sphingomonas sp. IC-11]